MTTTDPIADMLTRIRNATLVSHPAVEMPSSKLKIAIAKILQEQGYIQGYELKTVAPHNFTRLRINLKYDTEGYPVIRNIKRVSRPGLRRYLNVSHLPRVLDGAGIAIVSTNRGVITDKQARKLNVGGEILCTVY
jgi:small subunit ribosomal protein S8